MALHPILSVQAVVRNVGIRDEHGDGYITHAQDQQGTCDHSCKSVQGATTLKVHPCHAQQKSSLSNSCCMSPHCALKTVKALKGLHVAHVACVHCHHAWHEGFKKCKVCSGGAFCAVPYRKRSILRFIHVGSSNGGKFKHHCVFYMKAVHPSRRCGQAHGGCDTGYLLLKHH